MNQYHIHTKWSEEDSCLLAEVPQLPGCIADGASEAEALQHAQESIIRWIKMAEFMGREVPAPEKSASAFASV